jgi:kynureninase
MGSVNLLDWDDGTDIITTPVSASAANSASLQSGKIVLKEWSEQLISSNKFQQLWTDLPTAFNGKICSLTVTPSSVGEVEALFKQEKVGF